MNTLHDAQTQIRSFLKVLNLIAPDHDGFEERGKVDDYATDWAAVLLKDAWYCIYAEWTDDGEMGFQLRLDAGHSHLLALHFICGESGHGDSGHRSGWSMELYSTERGDDPNDRVLVEQFINEAWPELQNYKRYSGPPGLPASERHNPTSPYMMGVIVRIINWFAQLPYSKLKE